MPECPVCEEPLGPHQYDFCLECGWDAQEDQWVPPFALVLEANQLEKRREHEAQSPRTR